MNFFQNLSQSLLVHLLSNLQKQAKTFIFFYIPPWPITTFLPANFFSRLWLILFLKFPPSFFLLFSLCSPTRHQDIIIHSVITDSENRIFFSLLFRYFKCEENFASINPNFSTIYVQNSLWTLMPRKIKIK